MAVDMQFAYRTQKSIGASNVAHLGSAYTTLFDLPISNRCFTYSPCGRYLAWANPEGVTVVDTSSGNVITRLSMTHVFEIGFSPRGSYLITWERSSKDENGDAVKNLKVWRTVEEIVDGQEKQVVGKFVQKSQTGWNLQYTSDERYCARTVTNAVQFYESGNLSNVWNTLRVEGVAEFELSPGNNNSVAVFIPERKVSQTV